MSYVVQIFCEAFFVNKSFSFKYTYIISGLGTLVIETNLTVHNNYYWNNNNSAIILDIIDFPHIIIQYPSQFQLSHSNFKLFSSKLVFVLKLFINSAHTDGVPSSLCLCMCSPFTRPQSSLVGNNGIMLQLYALDLGLTTISLGFRVSNSVTITTSLLPLLSMF